MRLLRFLVPVAVAACTAFGTPPPQRSAGDYIMINASTTQATKRPSSRADFSFQWGGASLVGARGIVPLMLEDTVSGTVKLPRTTMGDVLCSHSKPFAVASDSRSITFEMSAHFAVEPIGEYEKYYAKHQGALWIQFDVIDAASGEAVLSIWGTELLARHGESLDTTVSRTFSLDLEEAKKKLRPHCGKPLSIQAWLMASPSDLTASRLRPTVRRSVMVMDDRSGARSGESGLK